MDVNLDSLDTWIESIERRIADTLNAKAGRTVYVPSGANVDAHALDCPDCLTDYTH